MTSNEPLTQDSSALERLDRVGWLHFYQMGRLQRPSHAPKIVVRADGIHLWDEKGRRYIDGLSGSYCMNLGYGRTSILERAHAAAMALPYASPFVCAHPWGVDLAYALSELARPVVGALAHAHHHRAVADDEDLGELMDQHDLRQAQGACE